MAPLEVEVGDKYENLWTEIRALGYIRMRVDSQTYSVDTPPQISASACTSWPRTSSRSTWP